MEKSKQDWFNYRRCTNWTAHVRRLRELQPSGFRKNRAEKFFNFKYHNKISGKLMNGFTFIFSTYKFFKYLKHFKYLRTHIRMHTRTYIPINIPKVYNISNITSISNALNVLIALACLILCTQYILYLLKNPGLIPEMTPKIIFLNILNISERTPERTPELISKLVSKKQKIIQKIITKAF